MPRINAKVCNAFKYKIESWLNKLKIYKEENYDCNESSNNYDEVTSLISNQINILITRMQDTILLWSELCFLRID